MKSIPVGCVSGQKPQSRWSRLLLALTVCAIGAATAVAQTVGITTVAGQALTSGLVDNATGTSARFNNPAGLAADATSIYIADSANNAIRKLTIATGAVSTLISTGLSSPGGVAVDGAGKVYVADSGNHVIRRYSAAGALEATFGVASTSGLVNGTLATSRFSSPQGIAVNAAGTLIYVADTGNDVIRRIDIGGDAVTTIATGFKPYGVALNAAGTILYATDFGTHSIRSVTLAGNVLATVAGTVSTAGSTDAPALFRNPQGITVDAAGDLYVADTVNQIIRKISGATVTTIAGSAGSLGNTDAVGTSARFQGPFGIVATGVNTLYISDSNNHTIRRASPTTAPTITSANNTTFVSGVTGTFTVTSTGSPAATYSVSSGSLPSFATLNATTGVISGMPSNATGSPFTFTIQASNGVAPAATQVFTLTVTQPPAITSTNAATFSVNNAGSFTVVATGSPAPTFSITGGTFPPWASLNTTTGAITGTPTNNTGSPFTFTIQASNGVGTAATQSFTLTVNNGPGINTQPANSSTLIGQNATFTVVATGTPAPTYQWQRQPAAGGGFSALPEGGTYTGTQTATLTVNSVSGAMNGDQFQVVITNGVGSPVTSSTATLTAAQVPAITSGASTTFVVNQAGSLSVTSTGTPAPSYSIIAGSFPPWASINGTTGSITGTPTNTTGAPFAFTIQASNGVAPAATQAFTLNVSLADVIPAISTQPTSVSVQLGAAATFTAAATGTPAPTLRWQRQPAGTSGFVDLSDDGTYSGTTTGTLTVAAAVAGMTGDQFRVIATNTISGTTNTATSSVATLTVNIGTTITTFAGTAGLAGSADGTGAAARFNTPASIAVDPFGNFYVADAANHVIRKISAAGVVTTLAGTAGVSGSVDGSGAAARFNGPSAVAVNSAGTVFVADTYNHTIRSISAAGDVVTIAGSANAIGFVDGTGGAARFSFPAGIAVDNSANIYVADSSNHVIRRVTTGGVVTVFAGTGGTAGSVDGTGTAARFSYPNNLALDSAGNLYVADSFNHLIRKVNAAAVVTTLAGGAGLAGSTDGNGVAARFNQPTGVAVDTAGVVYVADTFNNTIRKIATNGDVTTLAGAAGASGTADGVGGTARFTQPFAITVDSSGNLYIADTRNNVIRRSGTTSAPGVQTQPQNRTVPVGGTTTFTVVATGAPAPTYQWQRQLAGQVTFTNLTNDGIHSGATTATLTVANVVSSMNGDQYRVILANGINPAATSGAATLTIGEVPAFTSVATATFKATEAGTFTVTASGTPSSTFTSTALPAWLTLSSAGVLSGTPPAGAEGTYTFTLTANNGATVTQAFTLTVTPAVLPPTISTQPISASIRQGENVTFSVTAAGTAPLTYQWRKNGAAIVGATSATYTVGNAQPSSSGVYSVVVTNAAGTVTSANAELIVNTVPFFASQPRSQSALAGSVVTFEVSATGSASFTYQWRKNGVAIVGATSPVLTLNGVTAADSASYDVVVTNVLGSVTSSLALLNVTSTPSAPVITAQPAARTALAGTAASLSVAASGVPSPTYQWRKNGATIAGATSAVLALPAVNSGDAANYDVVISNASGSVTSVPAALRVIARSYAGYYFGSFSGGVGSFAIYVREDNTGVFLGYVPGASAPVNSLNILVSDAGTFNFAQAAIAGEAAAAGEPARAAALGGVTVVGSIGTDGAVTGSLLGGANASLSGARSPDTGTTQTVAGFYTAGAAASAATSYTIAGPNGQAFVVTQSGNASDGGPGSVGNTGAVSVVTNRSVISATIVPGTGTITGSVAGGVAASFNGGSENALGRQRLVNISSRARVGTGDSVAIAGFVISGEESKPVLIRAVGPTLGSAFGLTGALASPRLELFRGSTSLAVNTGIAANRVAIDAAGAQAGAFALGASGADAAILTTLAPGNYTAIVSSSTNTAGIALIEVYDLSAAATGQKLLNIATRASAGTAEATLIAGFVVPPGPSKRVLVRGVGPGLTPFGVTGVLAQPVLTVLSGSTTAATNTGVGTSTDAAAIAAASQQVGAFGLAAADSAVIVTLAPGNYTAQVTGVGGATGVALIEVYELP